MLTELKCNSSAVLDRLPVHTNEQSISSLHKVSSSFNMALVVLVFWLL